MAAPTPAPIPTYSRNPAEHPLRYYSLLEEVEEKIRSYKVEEMMGAARIMKIVSEFMWAMHFDQRIDFNAKSLVKTMDEIADIVGERLHNQLIKEQATNSGIYSSNVATNESI
jgi:hypothetical protein